MPEDLCIRIAPGWEVSAHVYPAADRGQIDATVILGHGAGANQRSDFMTRFAAGLAARGISAVTFNFLYMEQGRRMPDSNCELEACFRAVIEAVREQRAGHGTLVIGGKSLGGRIASQFAAAAAPIADGLIFLGYPLHPPGRLDQLRAKHLPEIKVPMSSGCGRHLRSERETSRAGRQDKKDTGPSRESAHSLCQRDFTRILEPAGSAMRGEGREFEA